MPVKEEKREEVRPVREKERRKERRSQTRERKRKKRIVRNNKEGIKKYFFCLQSSYSELLLITACCS